MDWANEYWIKCYVEDSPSFARCSWVAKGLFFLLARRFNAAGMLRLEKGKPIESIQFICEEIGAKWSDLREPLLELIQTETIVIDEDWAFLKSPNFVEAQRAKWGENHRKKAYRRRQRDDEKAKDIDFNPADPETLEAQLPPAVPTKVPDIPMTVPEFDRTLEEGVQGFRQGLVQGFETLQSGVPKTDTEVQGLVQGFGNRVPKTDTEVQGFVPKTDTEVQGFVSHIVTLQPSVPNTDEMSHTDQIDRSRSIDPSDLSSSSKKEAPEGSDPEGCNVDEAALQQPSLFKGEQFGTTRKDRDKATVNRVWERYMAKWVKSKTRGPNPVLTSKRRKQILTRCREFGVENVLIAVDRLFENEWRVSSGYTLIDYAIRSTEQTEKVLATDPNPKPNRSGSGGNGRSRQSYAIQQGAPRKDYEGTGSQWRTGADGKMRDEKTGKTVELEPDPLGLGIDFDALSEQADRS